MILNPRDDVPTGAPLRVTALAGGVGGARFLRGLLHTLAEAGQHVELTVVANTGDDITLHGLRVCPDVDTLLYTLGGVVHEGQGWGRAEESQRVAAELAAYGAQPQWFTLGDLDLGAHIARTAWLATGIPLSEVTTRLATRWGLPERGVRILPMTDVPVETHVVLDAEDEPGGERAVHFQQWWVQLRASVPARRFVVAGLDQATAGPGVLDAIRTADVVLLPPSNPVVSIGVVLGVPGVRDALRGTPAPVVGVSPLVAGAPVRGHADACLAALGLPSTSAAVVGLYADFLDGWLVDPDDLASTAADRPEGVQVAAFDGPLLMTDVAAAGRIARAALDLADAVRSTATVP